MGALFGKARAVENQQPFAVGNHRPEPPPHAVGVPARFGDEVLEGYFFGASLGLNKDEAIAFSLADVWKVAR